MEPRTDVNQYTPPLFQSGGINIIVAFDGAISENDTPSKDFPILRSDGSFTRMHKEFYLKMRPDYSHSKSSAVCGECLKVTFPVSTSIYADKKRLLLWPLN